MVQIRVKKGLDIPIKGKPSGTLQTLSLPKYVSLDLSPFGDIRFRLKVEEGDAVRIGQPLLEDKKCPGRLWTSPAGGIISEIRRGAKRRLLDIVIRVTEPEEFYPFSPFSLQDCSSEELIKHLKEGGVFTSIRVRPFNRLADPEKYPRSIFVKAVESAPFVPPAELQIQGLEEDFQIGLEALSRLSKGKVHLVYGRQTSCSAFIDAKYVEKHTVEGPHPAGTFSVFIHEIDPIIQSTDVVWTLTAYHAAEIGHFLRTGRPLIERVISIAGPGIVEGRTGYFKVRRGTPIETLLANRIEDRPLRFISGDPLMGRSVQRGDFLGFDDTCFCVIPESQEREFLHFFRLGTDKFSSSKAYLSGHLGSRTKEYTFTTNLHGEQRAFIDPTLYEKVVPLDISVIPLMKAIMAEDYELAEELGLLEVDAEDFALATFVCPSKIEMTELVREALSKHAAEVLG